MENPLAPNKHVSAEHAAFNPATYFSEQIAQHVRELQEPDRGNAGHEPLSATELDFMATRMRRKMEEHMGVELSELTQKQVDDWLLGSDLVNFILAREAVRQTGTTYAIADKDGLLHGSASDEDDARRLQQQLAEEKKES